MPPPTISTLNRAVSVAPPQPHWFAGAVLFWMFRSYGAFRRAQEQVESRGIHF